MSNVTPSFVFELERELSGEQPAPRSYAEALLLDERWRYELRRERVLGTTRRTRKQIAIAMGVPLKDPYAAMGEANPWWRLVGGAP